MANSIDPDEMAHYEPSHLDQHHLQRFLFWSTLLKGLNSEMHRMSAQSQSPLGVFSVAKEPKFFQADSKDSDQSVWMHKLV